MARLRAASASRRSPAQSTSAVPGPSSARQGPEDHEEEEVDPITPLEDIPFPLPGEDYDLDEPSPPASTPSYTGVVGRAAFARRTRSQRTASPEVDNPPPQREFRPRARVNAQHASPLGPLSSPSTAASSSPGIRPSPVRESTSPVHHPIRTSPVRSTSSPQNTLTAANDQRRRPTSRNRPVLNNRADLVDRRLQRRARRREHGLRSRTVSTSPSSVGSGHPWNGRNFPSPGTQLQGELDRAVQWDEEMRRRGEGNDETMEDADEGPEQREDDAENFGGHDIEHAGTPPAGEGSHPADFDEYYDVTPPRQLRRATPVEPVADNVDEEILPDYVSDEQEDDIPYRDRIFPFGPAPARSPEHNLPRLEDFLASDDEEEEEEDDDELANNHDVVTYTGVSPGYVSRRPLLPVSPSLTPTASSLSRPLSSPSAPSEPSQSVPSERYQSAPSEHYQSASSELSQSAPSEPFQSTPSDPSPSMINPNRSSVPAGRAESASRSPSARPGSSFHTASNRTASAQSPTPAQHAATVRRNNASVREITPDYLHDIFGSFVQREDRDSGGSSDDDDDDDSDGSGDIGGDDSGDYDDQDDRGDEDSRNEDSEGSHDEDEEKPYEADESEPPSSEVVPDLRFPVEYPRSALSYGSPSPRRLRPRPNGSQKSTPPRPTGNGPRTPPRNVPLPLPTFPDAPNHEFSPSVASSPPGSSTPSSSRRNNASNPNRVSPPSALRDQYEEEIRLLRDELHEVERLRENDRERFEADQATSNEVAETLSDALDECMEHRRQLEAREATRPVPAPTADTATDPIADADADCPERLRRALETVEEHREELERVNAELDRVTAERDADLDQFMTTAETQEERIQEAQALLAMREQEEDDNNEDDGPDSTTSRDQARPNSSPARRAAAANARELEEAQEENSNLIADNAMLQAYNDELRADAARDAALIEELQASDEGILRAENDQLRLANGHLQQNLENERATRQVLEEFNRDLVEQQRPREDMDANEQLPEEPDADVEGDHQQTPPPPPPSSSPERPSPREVYERINNAETTLANTRALVHEVLDSRERLRAHAQNQNIWLRRIDSGDPIRPEERVHRAIRNGEPPVGYDYGPLYRQEANEARAAVGGREAVDTLWDAFEDLHQYRDFRAALLDGDITLQQHDALSTFLRLMRYDAGEVDEDDEDEEDNDESDSESEDDDDEDGDGEEAVRSSPTGRPRTIQPRQGMSPRFIRRDARRTASQEDDQRESLSPHVRFARGTSYSPEAVEIFLDDEEEEIPAEEPGDGEATPRQWENDDDHLFSPNSFLESEPSPSPYVPPRSTSRGPIPSRDLRRSAREPRLSQRALESQEMGRNLQPSRDEDDEDEDDGDDRAPSPKRRRMTQATRGRVNAPVSPPPVPTSSSPTSGPDVNHTPSRLPRNALIPVVNRNEVNRTLTSPTVPKRMTRSATAAKRKRDDGGK